MNHSHIELIEDPQWVSYCVENECSFRDHIQGYVCRTHCSRHVCSGSSCSLIQTMVTRTRYQTGSFGSSCPVAALLVFHKPELEFRGPYYIPDKGDPVELGYGAKEYQPAKGVCCSDGDGDHIIIKASLSVIVALFSTALSEGFRTQYDIIDKSQGVNTSTGTPSLPWMAKIFELAEVIELKTKPELPCSLEISLVVKEAALKTAVSISTLFNSRRDMIKRFMKRVTCRYNDKHAKRADFYTMVVMLTLCFFPYLKHRVLCDLFNNRTLVIMCFDKTRTRHNQWSTLSTHVHLHVNQPEFVNRVLSTSNLDRGLPIVVTVTLTKYIAEASYSDRDSAMAHIQTPGDRRDRLEQCEVTNEPETGKVSSLHEIKPKRIMGKRRTPCSAGYYETHEGRVDGKVMRLKWQ